MATYPILIYGDDATLEAESPEESERKGVGHAAFSARAGVRVVGGGQLQGSSTAVSCWPRPHRRLVVTDGPLLESKKVIGGYYMIEATHRDKAVEYARFLPELSGDHGGVEI